MFRTTSRHLASALVAAALLTSVALASATAVAQEQGEPAFTPTLFVLGSTTNNEFRSSGEPVGDSALYAEVELPVTFRGPRWSCLLYTSDAADEN